MSTSAHCHKRIAQVAKEAAANSYEELMHDNVLFSVWKAKNPSIAHDPKRLRQHFVNLRWGWYIDLARTTLALLLREPIDDKIKEEIVDILAKDSTLIRGRVNPVKVAGQLVNKQ